MSLETEILERRVGQTLRGKWTLERLLGSGGMAAVYVAHHKIGRRDAIKILHPEIAANRELTARFEQEAHAVNRFKHPGAVSILDIDTTEDGAPFLVMELLDGESLEARRQRGPIDPVEALRLADELLDVLAAAHASDIIHRDIKPDNLFILPDGRLKVLDFGIARMREGKSRTMHTALGVTIGTLSYMPPEQVAGEAIDVRADLFAVGCTMFEMASGRLPHEGANEIELMVKMGMMPAPPLASVCPSADPGLCLVVDRALAFSKERRYPDAVTMQADVRALRAGGAPRYATARLAAGDVPNPPESAKLSGLLGSPSMAAIGSASMPVIGLPSMPVIGLPSMPAIGSPSMPILGSPSPSMPLLGSPSPSLPLLGSLSPSMPHVAAYRATTAATPPSAAEVAPVAVSALTLRGSSRRDRIVAVIAVIATLLLCLTVVSWRVLRSHGDETTASPTTIAPPTETAAPAAPGPSEDPSPSDPGDDVTPDPEDEPAPVAAAPTPAPAPAPAPAPQNARAPGSPIPKLTLPKLPFGKGKKHRRH